MENLNSDKWINEVAESFLKNMHRHFIFEDENLNLVDITGRETLKQYIGGIWDILTKSYENIGGFKNASSPKQLLRQITKATIYGDGKIIHSVAIYTDYLGSNKLTAIGSDGTAEGKNGVSLIMQRDISQQFEGWYWCEASGAVEHLFKKHNGNPVPSIFAEEILKKNVTIVDEVHYKRTIGKDGDVFIKMIFGFKDSTLYHKIEEAIENYADFKETVNKIKTINESSHIGLTTNLAIELINRVYEMSTECEVDILTHTMYTYLLWSYRTLRIYWDGENQQWKHLMELSKYYMENYPLLELNIF